MDALKHMSPGETLVLTQYTNGRGKNLFFQCEHESVLCRKLKSKHFRKVTCLHNNYTHTFRQSYKQIYLCNAFPKMSYYIFPTPCGPADPTLTGIISKLLNAIIKVISRWLYKLHDIFDNLKTGYRGYKQRTCVYKYRDFYCIFLSFIKCSFNSRVTQPLEVQGHRARFLC